MNRDFVELLSAFIDHQVDHLVVGAHALAAHGHVRATKDLDVWIRPTPENAARAYAARQAFGAPLFDLEPADLSTPGDFRSEWLQYASTSSPRSTASSSTTLGQTA